MSAAAHGVELKIFSTHAVLDVMNALAPRFEHETGNKLSFHYDPAKAVRRQIESGAAFDVAIVTRPVFDALAGEGHLLPETRADIGRCGLGVAVRKGAAKPDIATTEAFKRALLAAKSIVRSTEGTSGMYFEALLDRLGIADAMRGKIVLGPGGRVAELVARGEAELAVQQIAELLPVKGADFVGPFPPDLQLYSTFSAGVATARKSHQPPRPSSPLLRRPRRRCCSKRAGLEPRASRSKTCCCGEENAMRPFEGIRVIDVTHVLAGPFAAYQLAVLGADVIKVEHPDDPDQSRGAGTDKELNRRNMGTAFLTQASNKRSITLDLKQEKDREILKKLVATADVFVENYRPGAFEALGLGYEALSAINPRLIYASFSAFGQNGPRGEQTAYDHVIQATSGIMAMTGTKEVNPIKFGSPAIDYATGMTGAFAFRRRCSSASAPARASASTWPCSTWR